MTALWIKICGLTSPDALDAAVEAGADAVGFVFHPPSPRHLSWDRAEALAARVPAHIDRVAVFLHPDQAMVDAALSAIAPNWLQMDIAALDALVLPTAQQVLPVLRSFMPRPPPRLLFEGTHSGAGEPADWQLAATLAANAELVLAGGLDAGNVAAAIAAVRPFGVDVSSGVERERGHKDVSLILAFVEAARRAQWRLDVTAD